jgi:hypothetical protein
VPENDDRLALLKKSLLAANARTMGEFLFPLWLLDLVLAITLLEFAVLALRQRRSRQGLGPLDLAYSLAPGFLLMLALRLTHPVGLAPGVMLCVALAGVVHAADFYRRQRSGSGSGP